MAWTEIQDPSSQFPDKEITNVNIVPYDDVTLQPDTDYYYFDGRWSPIHTDLFQSVLDERTSETSPPWMLALTHPLYHANVSSLAGRAQIHGNQVTSGGVVRPTSGYLYPRFS